MYKTLILGTKKILNKIFGRSLKWNVAYQFINDWKNPTLSKSIIIKNPKNSSAGKLLDDAGLKGLSIGDAKISEKHANFFINDGNASSSDMLMLIKKAHQKVKDRFNVNLSLEVRLLGFDEREIEGLC